jgi:hypothetical protein
MTKALAVTEKLARTTKKGATDTRSALDQFVAQEAGRDILLVDASSSMGNHLASGERRVDAMRKVVDMLRETHPVPVVSFQGSYANSTIAVVDEIPEPSGGTPLHEAIDFCTDKGATHIVLVSDGVPASEGEALDAARRFGGVIDVFYIGDGNDKGARFCQRLAQATGGTANVDDLGAPKQLHAKIAGLLPEAVL